tara:strand:- start:195 stop:419 length:225 start_codon:yes stop_codon:yes gene_type:complete
MSNEYILDWRPNAFILYNNKHHTEAVVNMSEAFTWSTDRTCQVTKSADRRMDEWIEELQRLKPKNPIPAKGVIR